MKIFLTEDRLLKKFSTALIYVAIFVLIIILATGGLNLSGEKKEITYYEFLQKVEADEIAKVQVTGTRLVALKKTDSVVKNPDRFPGQYDYNTTITSSEVFQNDIRAIVAKKLGISADLVSAKDYPFELQINIPSGISFYEIASMVLLLAAMIGIVIFIMRQQSGGASKAMNFAKSQAKTNIDRKKKVTFNDVAGEDEEKEELKEVVDFLKAPKKYTDMGARIPKGVLLVGPPGTGKTLLAKAVAGEADVPFFAISGSDFVEMFVGVGASRVRDLFGTAKKSAPSVIFIDEIDAVGRQRGAGLGGGHDEKEQTLNQLLVEMDGFATNEGIIVIAATNRPDILDPALLRPGRFDRQIVVNYPDVKGREEILKVHSKNKKLGDDVDLKTLAKMTPGFTGADLENVLNESAILAARYNKTQINMSEVEEAITRVIVGPEKKSRVILDDEKKLTAYHESGHAIVALKLKGNDPIHEVSIIPRGMAGGYTMTLPEKDSSYRTKNKLLDEIAMMLGGRVAEDVALDDISTGAYSDLQKASNLARKMVVEYGMSDKIGPVFLGGQAEVFIGKELGHQINYSESTAKAIDDEVRAILEEQYARAKEAIGSDMSALDRVANALMEHETVTGEEFAAIYRGENIEIAEKKYKVRKNKDNEENAENNKADENSESTVKTVDLNKE